MIKGKKEIYISLIKRRRNMENITKDILYDLYVVQLKTISEICKQYGTYYKKVKSKMVEFGIEPIKGDRRTLHNMSNTRIYSSWNNMVSVCKCPTASGYKNVGGKGISYSDSWVYFVDFYKDMRKLYKDDCFLTRYDKTKDYSVKNCYWGTVDERSYNASSNIKIIINNRKYTTREASEKYGIKEKTIQARYEKGWRGLRLVEPIEKDYIKNIPHMKEFYDNGGIFKSREYVGFGKEKKLKIITRDNFQCQECKISNEESILKYGCSLHIHHINYDKSDSSDINLISLCPVCHGKTNIYNKEYWEERCSTIMHNKYKK